MKNIKYVLFLLLSLNMGLFAGDLSSGSSIRFKNFVIRKINQYRRVAGEKEIQIPLGLEISSYERLLSEEYSTEEELFEDSEMTEVEADGFDSEETETEEEGECMIGITEARTLEPDTFSLSRGTRVSYTEWVTPDPMTGRSRSLKVTLVDIPSRENIYLGSRSIYINQLANGDFDLFNVRESDMSLILRIIRAKFGVDAPDFV